MSSKEKLNQLLIKKSKLYQELDFVEQEIKIFKSEKNKQTYSIIQEDKKESSLIIHSMFFGIIFVMIYLAYISEHQHTSNILLGGISLFLFDLLYISDFFHLALKKLTK
jgi:hypothetical protein